MKNSEYWRGRFSLLERSTYKTAQAALREMEALYRQALYRTRKELDSWCTRFADDNGVSLTEARRLLGAKELEEFRWDVAQYISSMLLEAVLATSAILSSSRSTASFR